MKPRIKLAEAVSPAGEAIELYEHDGRFLMHWHGSRLLSEATREAELSLATLGCAPFRPVGQPRVLIAGLGLGHLAVGALAALTQKRARFVVVEPTPEVVEWNRTFLAPSHPGLLEDPRLEIEARSVEELLAKEDGAWHAILVHLDIAPPPRGKGDHLLATVQDLRRAAAALKDGGLLTLAAARRIPGLSKKLTSAGFTVAEHEIPVSTASKRPRFHHVWLARRGSYRG